MGRKAYGSHRDSRVAEISERYSDPAFSRPRTPYRKKGGCMSMKKTLFAVSLSFLVILSQAGCGSGAGANPPAGSAATGSDSASASGSGAAAGTAGGTGPATSATIPPTAGPLAPGPVASLGTTVATGAPTPVAAPAPAGTPAVSGTPAATGVATLAWDAGAVGATGFRVYYGTSSRSYTNKISVGLVPGYSVTLPPGTYYFVVTAYDASGNESVYSNEVSKTIS